MDPYPNLPLAVLMLLASALLEAGRTGLTMLPDSSVKRMASSEDARERRIAKLLEKPSAFFDGLYLAWTCCFTAALLLTWESLQAIDAMRLASAGLLERAALQAVVFALLLLLLNMLCNLLPHQVACHSPQSVALALTPLCRLFALLFLPLSKLCSSLARILSRLFGARPEEDLEQVTEEEIRMLVDVGNEKGAIEQSEKEMINNIFDFGDRCVSEVMTHRTDMAAIPLEASLEEVVRMAMESGYSRIPVYRGNIDNIVGLLYVKDLLGLTGRPSEAFDVQSYMRKVFFIPENMACVELFSQLQQKKIQVAIAVDEYGGTAGIVSMEDLLESIVGNIQDEYDDEEEEVFRLGDDCYLVDGTISIDDVEHLFNTSLNEKDSEYDTIGGLLTDKLGGLPDPNEHPAVVLAGISFTVILVADRRIARIRAERAESPS